MGAVETIYQWIILLITLTVEYNNKLKDNNSNNNSDNNTHTVRSVIVNFFNIVVPFGHLLCIDRNGYHVIDILIKWFDKYQIIHVLQQFINEIIIENFSLVIKHSFSCKIVQNMLSSQSSYQLRFYLLAQLTTLFFRRCASPTIIKSTVRGASELSDSNNTESKPPVGTSEDEDNEDNKNETNDFEDNDTSAESRDFQFLYAIMNDANGNYIIQAMVDGALEQDLAGMISYSYSAVIKRVFWLSCNKYGNRVVQCCIVSPNCDLKTKMSLFVNYLNH